MPTSTTRYALQPPAPLGEDYATLASLAALNRINRMPALKKPECYTNLYPTIQREPAYVPAVRGGGWDLGFAPRAVRKEAPRPSHQRLAALRAWLASMGSKKLQAS